MNSLVVFISVGLAALAVAAPNSFRWSPLQYYPSSMDDHYANYDVMDDYPDHDYTQQGDYDEENLHGYYSVHSPGDHSKTVSYYDGRDSDYDADFKYEREPHIQRPSKKDPIQEESYAGEHIHGPYSVEFHDGAHQTVISSEDRETDYNFEGKYALFPESSKNDLTQQKALEKKNFQGSYSRHIDDRRHQTDDRGADYEADDKYEGEAQFQKSYEIDFREQEANNGENVKESYSNEIPDRHYKNAIYSAVGESDYEHGAKYGDSHFPESSESGFNQQESYDGENVQETYSIEIPDQRHQDVTYSGDGDFAYDVDSRYASGDQFPESSENVFSQQEAHDGENMHESYSIEVQDGPNQHTTYSDDGDSDYEEDQFPESSENSFNQQEAHDGKNFQESYSIEVLDGPNQHTAYSDDGDSDYEGEDQFPESRENSFNQQEANDGENIQESYSIEVHDGSNQHTTYSDDRDSDYEEDQFLESSENSFNQQEALDGENMHESYSIEVQDGPNQHTAYSDDGDSDYEGEDQFPESSENSFNQQEANDGENIQESYSIEVHDGPNQHVTYSDDGDSDYDADNKHEGEDQFPESGENGLNQQEAYDGRNFQESFSIEVIDGSRQHMTYADDGESDYVSDGKYEGEDKFPESSENRFNQQEAHGGENIQESYSIEVLDGPSQHMTYSDDGDSDHDADGMYEGEDQFSESSEHSFNRQEVHGGENVQKSSSIEVHDGSNQYMTYSDDGDSDNDADDKQEGEDQFPESSENGFNQQEAYDGENIQKSYSIEVLDGPNQHMTYSEDGDLDYVADGKYEREDLFPESSENRFNQQETHGGENAQESYSIKVHDGPNQHMTYFDDGDSEYDAYTKHVRDDMFPESSENGFNKQEDNDGENIRESYSIEISDRHHKSVEYSDDGDSDYETDVKYERNSQIPESSETSFIQHEVHDGENVHESYSIEVSDILHKDVTYSDEVDSDYKADVVHERNGQTPESSETGFTQHEFYDGENVHEFHSLEVSDIHHKDVTYSDEVDSDYKADVGYERNGQIPESSETGFTQHEFYNGENVHEPHSLEVSDIHHKDVTYSDEVDSDYKADVVYERNGLIPESSETSFTQHEIYDGENVQESHSLEVSDIHHKDATYSDDVDSNYEGDVGYEREDQFPESSENGFHHQEVHDGEKAQKSYSTEVLEGHHQAVTYSDDNDLENYDDGVKYAGVARYPESSEDGFTQQEAHGAENVYESYSLEVFDRLYKTLLSSDDKDSDYESDINNKGEAQFRESSEKDFTQQEAHDEENVKEFNSIEDQDRHHQAVTYSDEEELDYAGDVKDEGEAYFPESSENFFTQQGANDEIIKESHSIEIPDRHHQGITYSAEADSYYEDNVNYRDDAQFHESYENDFNQEETHNGKTFKESYSVEVSDGHHQTNTYSYEVDSDDESNVKYEGRAQFPDSSENTFTQQDDHDEENQEESYSFEVFDKFHKTVLHSDDVDSDYKADGKYEGEIQFHESSENDFTYQEAHNEENVQESYSIEIFDQHHKANTFSNDENVDYEEDFKYKGDVQFAESSENDFTRQGAHDEENGQESYSVEIPDRHYQGFTYSAEENSDYEPSVNYEAGAQFPESSESAFSQQEAKYEDNELESYSFEVLDGRRESFTSDDEDADYEADDTYEGKTQFSDSSEDDFTQQEAHDEENIQESYSMEVLDKRHKTVIFSDDEDSVYKANVKYEGDTRFPKSSENDFTQEEGHDEENTKESYSIEALDRHQKVVTHADDDDSDYQTNVNHEWNTQFIESSENDFTQQEAHGGENIQESYSTEAHDRRYQADDGDSDYKANVKYEWETQFPESSENDFTRQETHDGENVQKSNSIEISDGHHHVATYFDNGDSDYKADDKHDGEVQFPKSSENDFNQQEIYEGEDLQESYAIKHPDGHTQAFASYDDGDLGYEAYVSHGARAQFPGSFEKDFTHHYAQEGENVQRTVSLPLPYRRYQAQRNSHNGENAQGSYYGQIPFGHHQVGTYSYDRDSDYDADVNYEVEGQYYLSSENDFYYY